MVLNDGDPTLPAFVAMDRADAALAKLQESGRGR
jgi:hypothetical protein